MCVFLQEKQGSHFCTISAMCVFLLTMNEQPLVPIGLCSESEVRPNFLQDSIWFFLNTKSFSAHASLLELKTSFIYWVELAASTESSLHYVYQSMEKSSSGELTFLLPRASMESLAISHHHLKLLKYSQ